MRNAKLYVIGVVIVAAIIATLATIRIQTVGGNEIGVKETWKDGVVEEALGPKTYVLIPGFTQKIYTYPISQQVYVMNDRDDGQEFGEGRRGDAYLVQSAEGQDMRISFSTQWRRDPAFIVQLHKTVRDNVEERILRPELLRIVKDEATVMSALEAYAGEGLVKLQMNIQRRLQSPDGELRSRGIFVDNFVIENIGLDPKYREQITARQVAVQARLRAIEETKAAEAAAERAKAEAQADYERRVVEAERDKRVGVLEAEKEAEQQILGADAERQQNVLRAQGEKESGELRAQAILAIGEAEAEATRLKLAAYHTEGADAFVKIEVAKSMSEAFKNIKGYLPESMNVTLLAEQYSNGVNLLVNPQQPQQ